MTAFNDAVKAIRTIDNNADLRALFDELRSQQTYLSRQAIRSFVVGDSVKFDAGWCGEQIGEIIKVNRKNVKVKVGMTTWNVAASLLESV